MTKKMIEGKKNISVLYKGNAIENPLNRRIPQPEQNYTFFIRTTSKLDKQFWDICCKLAVPLSRFLNTIKRIS